MSRKRIRIDGKGQPKKCNVDLPPHLAAFLYRARVGGFFKDETELVCAIVRDWVKGQPPMDWPSVAAALRAEEETGAGE